MIVLDLETTGIHPERNCMLSLGAVDFDTGKTFYGECCVYRYSEIEDKALEINGFNREDIRPMKKQWPHELYLEFVRWCGQFQNHILAGHNIGHLDILFLESIHNQRINDGTPWLFGYRTVDLHTLAFAKWGESLSQEKICERLRLPPELKPHNALQGALSERNAIAYLLA